MGNDDDGAWFAPKTFGYGAGLPIAWQGWVVLLAVIGCSVLLVVVFAPLLNPVPLLLVVLGADLPLLLLVKAKTRGGWKWRNGRE